MSPGRLGAAGVVLVGEIVGKQAADVDPELTQSATRAEAAEVMAGNFDAYVSANRTCEIGMSRATGHEYRHLLEVLEQSSR